MAVPLRLRSAIPLWSILCLYRHLLLLPTASVCIVLLSPIPPKLADQLHLDRSGYSGNRTYTITAGGIGNGSNTVTLTWLTASTKNSIRKFIRNSNGCTATALVSNSLVVNPLPVPTFTVQPSNPVCIGRRRNLYNTRQTVQLPFGIFLEQAGTDYNITSGGVGNRQQYGHNKVVDSRNQNRYCKLHRSQRMHWNYSLPSNYH